MTAAQREHAEELFAELIGAETAIRKAVLASVDDAAVRAEVESLLGYTSGETRNLSSAIGGLMQAAGASGMFDARTVGPGSRFGVYRIERRLGQGGMGEVYEAVREDDFHKRVALKIVRFGLDSEFAHKQFQRERQVLAGLEHPYIARLIDGGQAENCPWLVLEYVEGVPIDSYCAGKPREATLQLFLKVCEAVSYAHRSLIIHRDIKPANVLVTDEGEPKLLDFGIARLLESGSADAGTTQTQFAAFTPQYASPEQVRGGAVTTATDIYSLGALLYELLTGRKPYVIPSSNAVEVDRIVCETEPARPGVSEDLDNIVMMALRKDPARRYASVQDFAGDIQRSLQHRPVMARPDTFGYRAAKFLRRNAVLVGAGAALFVAVAAGVTATVYQARLARERFEQVRKLAHSFVFDYDADLAKVDGNTAVREKMVRTALVYLDSLSKSAGGDLELQKELAGAWQKVGDAQGYPARPNLGHTDQAVASYRKAALLHDQILERDPGHRRDAGIFDVDYGNLLRLTGDFAVAERIGEQTLKNLQPVAAANPRDGAVQLALAQASCVLGDIDEDTLRMREAYKEFTRCDEAATAEVRRGHSREAVHLALQARERLVSASRYVGRLREALTLVDGYEGMLRESMKAEPANPALHRSYALLGQWRSSIYYDDDSPSLDDPANCLLQSRRYLEAIRGMVRQDPANASARLSEAIALFRLSAPLKLSDPTAAVASARESVRLFDSQIAAGKSSYLVVSRRARAVRRLSEALLAAGHKEEAALSAREALRELRRESVQNKHDVYAAGLLVMSLVTSAQTEDALRNFGAAEGYLGEAETIAAGLYAAHAGELTLLIPLSHVREASGAHWRTVGDEAKGRQAFGDALGLWGAFPEQNEFVKRRSADLEAVLREPSLKVRKVFPE